MAKVADRYLKVEPWAVVERGFDPKRERKSESLFSLANEYMGVRGYFDEGYSGDRLVGSYFQGLSEEMDVRHPQVFKGFIEQMAFSVNSVDWLYTRLRLDDETLDLATSRFRRFERRLDLREGTLSRSFVWETRGGKKLRVTFERFVSMVRPNLGCQRVRLEALNFSGPVALVSGLDFSPPHEIASGWTQTKASGSAAEGKNFWTCPKRGREGDVSAILGRTERSGQWALASFRLRADAGFAPRPMAAEKFIGLEGTLDLVQGSATTVEKIVVNRWERDRRAEAEAVWSAGMALAREEKDTTYEEALEAHRAFWAKAWEQLDIEVTGDAAVQQGLRFSLFHLYQTYHGGDARLNIPAKGMTGEAYGGCVFWDTETYCVPFYLFEDPKAARNLLLYRHLQLPQARRRAKELDCRGARFPFSTIDGTESCGTWQHGDLEDHVNVAVSYAIWLYATHTGDTTFLWREGIEMLLEISRYFASRGGWSPLTGEFGIWGVMGPDEYHMMVHNNCYTNYLVKKTFEFTLRVMGEMKRRAPKAWARAARKVGLEAGEPNAWRRMARRMRLPQNKKTGVFEQHDGYFDLPEVDVGRLGPSDIPIYKNWAYIRIFRHSMIKQPDVLLFLLFYRQDFSRRVVEANYDFYEPRCIHESSLSPGIHSIFATELGRTGEAVKFLRYVSRLDLDDYNRNTSQGLHVTAMSGAWLNVTYGLAGMRTDGERLFFQPTLPKGLTGYRFRLAVRGSVLEAAVDAEGARFRTVRGRPVAITLYGRSRQVNAKGLTVRLKPSRPTKRRAAQARRR